MTTETRDNPTAEATEGQREPIAPSRKLAASRVVHQLHAAFDAAQSSPDTDRHWALADSLSADAANSEAVRARLRQRARYEVANNSYAKGMANTIADDLIGTGPRLQVQTTNRELNGLIERRWREFAASRNLAEKLRVMRLARIHDGEAFAVISDNPGFGDLSLDLRVIEADRVTTPAPNFDQPVDGIVLDQFGQPTEYHVLKQHPGSRHAAGESIMSFDRLPADRVIHWFAADRPEQHRGIPEITPAMHLFAQLRRYTLAVLGSAEVAAVFAAVLQSEAPAEEADEVEPLDIFELERNMVTTLPSGWKLGQLRSEQPTTSYREFKREVLAEIARSLRLPFNVAAGDSSESNYASGRLDHQSYHKAISVDRHHLQQNVLEPLLAEFFREAALLGLLPGADIPRHTWFWDGHGHVDPQKEAAAQATRLTSGTTTLAAEFARDGKDWEAELEQRGREVARMRELGIPIPEVYGADATRQEGGSDATQ